MFEYQYKKSSWLMSWLTATGIALGLGLTSHAALASDQWPSKPVTIVVSFPPGGSTDLVGRILATEMSTTFKQSFIISNRPGAGGQVGTEYVAGQPNDGYTLLISATGHVMAPSIQSKINYKPVKDFEPIALIITMPNIIGVNPSLEPKTFQEFMVWGRKQQSIPYGSAGVGGATHLSGELLRHMSGLPLTHIAYKGMGPAMADTASGHTPAISVDTVSSGAMVSSGKIRPLAVTSEQRSKLYPDVPTLAESGFKGFDLNNWVGVYAPAGTPKPIVDKLSAEVIRIMNQPDIIDRMQKLGADSTNKLTPEEFRKYVENEVEKWRETIRITGVKTEN